MIALALTIAVFPIVGAAALLLQLPLPPTRSSRFAFVFLLGLGMQGSFLYLLGALHVPLTTIAFAALPVLSLPIVLVHRKHAKTLATRVEERHVLSAIVFALPLLVMLLAATVIPTRDYDGRVTWLPKARAIVLEQSIAGPFFHGERGLNLHNRYPLLMPLDVATVMALSGDTRNEAGRWLYLFVALSALVVARGFLRAWFGTTGAWVSAATAWLPLLTTIEGGALAAYNDFALAAFIGAAVLYLIEGEVRVAGLFAAFAVMTKNEGLALAVAVVVAALVTRRLRWTLLAPLGVAAALVAVGRRLVPAAYDEQYETLVTTLPRALGRVPEALAAIVRQAIGFHEWGVFWIAVLAAVLVGAFLAREKRFTIPVVTIAVALVAYVVALTVTSWSIADLAPVAVNRLLAHLLVPASTIVALVTHALGRAAPAR